MHICSDAKWRPSNCSDRKPGPVDKTLWTMVDQAKHFAPANARFELNLQASVAWLDLTIRHDSLGQARQMKAP